MTKPRLLHLLSQRPGRSGSGVFLSAMVRQAARHGYPQHAVAVGPEGTSHRELPPLGPEEFTPIVFPNPEAPFPVPGNSDVMPYPSTIFSEMTEDQVRRYRAVCRRGLEEVRDRFRPEVVHAHHLWLMTALVREVFAGIPMVATSHNAELRQAVRAPWLVPGILDGIRGIDRVCVLTPRSREDTVAAYGVDPERIAVTGAGYRPDLFHPPEGSPAEQAAALAGEFGIELPVGPDGEPEPMVTFIGRLSTAKGVPYLLEAARRLGEEEPERPWTLLLVGASGSNEDGRRMDELVREAGPRVRHLGAVPQAAVARVLGLSSLFVLSSLFEGLPLVMLEAAACGCPCLVAGLPPLASWVSPEWRESGCFELIPALAVTEADRPVAADEARYVADLAAGIERFLESPPSPEQRRAFAEAAREHTWGAVFDRYRAVYAEIGAG